MPLSLPGRESRGGEGPPDVSLDDVDLAMLEYSRSTKDKAAVEQ